MMAKSSFIAACVALLSAPVAFGQIYQDGVLAPPRGAWNGVEGAEQLQWACADGNAQMNSILEAVQTTFELQQELNGALGELSRHLGFGNTTGYNHAISVNVDEDLLGVLADDNRGAWNDGVLTADEMGDDPEAAALLQALRESIAAQLGIPVEDVILTDLTDDTGVIGRRRQLGEKSGMKKAFGFCENARCTLSL